MDTLLKKSLREQTSLDMIYMKIDGSISKRAIIVHQLNKHYIRAFCFKSRQTKTFKTENILAVAPARYRKGDVNFA
ncbi:hypothetical protein C6370_18180 [Bacillus atrophaeus]|uniref:hypothetical protein n=1 Tax=Bacillus atrophaeus TaxID=1452 RepID=UPI000D057B90|nr:hypothetical protein [Bacillus atrophaeus]MCY9159929.1 hypothetical protein [Bacillus atrophaeus]MEC0935395.1 hypothetical protein [Bacillus atrophaeus]PSA91461.1 hypothetical protein C6370_18180 [Bacillus atrophaeus]